jgi:hypothetical protein
VTAPAADIARLVDALERGDPLDHDDVRELLELALAQRKPTRFDLRAEIIYSAAEGFFQGCSAHDAAKSIAAGLGRYRATAWGRESLLSDCPQRHAGKVQSAYWQMLKTCDRPLGVDRIRKLLGSLKCPKSPDRFES